MSDRINWFGKLPGYRPSPAGAERRILRRLPALFVLGSLFLVLPSLISHLLAADEPAWLVTLDIYAISLIILHWTVVFTVAIAAVIVLVMKGPAYVADAYPLDEHDPAADRTPR